MTASFGSNVSLIFSQIVMEFCGGGSVSDCMHARKRCLTEPQIASVCKQIGHGLAYVHEKGKIHRDIKSGNILLDREGHAKLGTFLCLSRILSCCVVLICVFNSLF